MKPPSGPHGGRLHVSDDPKQALRARCWRRLEQAGAARWPGAHGRIPNFIGAERAASRLASTPEFQAAATLKCNPDSPQRPLRYAALLAGKSLYVAVPKLAGMMPFVVIKPGELPRHLWWDASGKAGFMRWGTPVAATEVAPIDLIIAGSVGAARSGARLGKGGGYADLEFSLLMAHGKISHRVTVATTIHSSQLCAEDEIVMKPNDISLDLIVTAGEVIRCPREFTRPSRIDPSLLDSSKRRSMPPIDAALHDTTKPQDPTNSSRGPRWTTVT